MNNAQLKQIVGECTAQLNQLGYVVPSITTYKLSNKMTRNFGSCLVKHKRSAIQMFSTAPFPSIRKKVGDQAETYQSNKTITITIAADLEGMTARNTIMHELLHAVDLNKSGHTGNWKQMATIVNYKFGYHIKRIALREESVGRKATVKQDRPYCVTCDQCGLTVYLTARHRAVKYPGRFVHRNCGGHYTVKKVEV